MTPLASSCAVCSEPCHTPVRCESCEAPHHGDCWVYNRRCATFACEARAARVPGGGLHRSWYGSSPRRYRRVVAASGPAPAACPVCSRGWKDETGARCAGCQRIFHEACWQGSGGCTLAACRQALRARPWAQAPTLLVGVGTEACVLCEGADPRPTSMACPTCARSFHPGCWVANRGCLRFECRASPSDDKKAA